MRIDPSEERLNALVDGELTPADAAALLELLRTDAALRDDVSRIRLCKELVRHAYADAAPAGRLHRRGPARHWRSAVAGLAVLGCGAVLGWAARERVTAPADPLAQLAEQTARSPRPDAERILLHLSSASAPHALAVLERAEGLLETGRTTGRTVTVEIVANGGGLDLLREGVSAHADRMARLRATHPGLTLVACGQTVQRLRERGVDVRLLPGATIATSALDEVVLRMQQGWAYVRI